ncbi:Gfo/Idh/MocA family protein [Allorhodopirellula heiligendammensis]|uniref:1,5-anhydro-D-fructose reductase n=1 Tax=Allorhodopirellula heiligendammensis TaxID=2714739 RepID=A0A5C6C239_9BACT|nr:Gfo/Idh/MocA family oxidoreductase [Allorhodopirellula heiligendammensis]TWU18232.1 1,5-anhydro-D-fructose reductase [Allorhodopirellula heiligendammensis]
MIRAAVVGVGFMGWIHALAYRRSNTAEMAGFASRSATKRSGDWRGIQGNFGPPGEQFDVSDMNVCEHLDGLLADDSIDLIDICLPPHLHVDAVTASLAAGKRVLCEKPLALTSAEAERLTSLASPGQLMVGHILPLMPEFSLLARMKADGRFGRVISGRFQRTIGPPDWIPDFYDLSRVGGPLLDLQVHDAHFIRLLFGMPQSVHTASHKLDGVPKRYETVLAYEDAVVSVGGGVIDSPARPFTHGYEVSFEQATVRFEFAAYSDGTTDSIPPVIMHNDGSLERPELGGGDPIDAFVTEIELAASVVAGAPLPPVLDPELASDAIKICEMQMQN